MDLASRLDELLNPPPIEPHQDEKRAEMRAKHQQQARENEERYLAEESCIDSEYIFERRGKTETRKAKHWIYTVAEIRRMLERAGFVINDVLGSLDRKPYELGSTELFVVAQRA